jgi:hypothetical protein
MSFTLQISDAVARSLRLPESERMSQWEFADLLGSRGIPRHYGVEEWRKTLQMVAVSNTCFSRSSDWS